MLRLYQLVIRFALTFGFSAGVCADNAESSVISPLETLGKLSAALVIVLLVFWLFARVLKQLQGSQFGTLQGLRVIGALPIGQREKVVVIQAGDEQILLGVTAAQVSTLHVLSKPLTQSTDKAQTDFKSKLALALKRQGGD